MIQRIKLVWAASGSPITSTQIELREISTGTKTIVGVVNAPANTFTTSIEVADISRYDYVITELSDGVAVGEPIVHPITAKRYTKGIGEALVLYANPAGFYDGTEYGAFFKLHDEADTLLVSWDGGVTFASENNPSYVMKLIEAMPAEGITFHAKTELGTGFDLLGVHEFTDIIQWSSEMTGTVNLKSVQKMRDDILGSVPRIEPPTKDFRKIFANLASMTTRLSSWDVSKVTKFDEAFMNNPKYAAGISNWAPAVVESKIRMFWGTDAHLSEIPSTLHPDPILITGIPANGTVEILAYPKLQIQGGVMVDWGDGTVEQIIPTWNPDDEIPTSASTPITHTYTDDLTTHVVKVYSESGLPFYLGHVVGASEVQSVGDMWLAGCRFAKVSEGVVVPNTLLTKVPTTSIYALENYSGMFQGCIAFNQDISGWDVSLAENVSSMFNGAVAFNQDLTGWQFNSVPLATDFAKDSGLTDDTLPNQLKPVS